MATIPWDDYPRLAEHRDQHMNEGPHREASAFQVGLDLILDGLQQTLGSSSAKLRGRDTNQRSRE